MKAKKRKNAKLATVRMAIRMYETDKALLEQLREMGPIPISQADVIRLALREYAAKQQKNGNE